MMLPSFACSLALSPLPTKDILKGKHITIFKSPDGGTVARDFTYIDNIMKGCFGLRFELVWWLDGDGKLLGHCDEGLTGVCGA